MFIMSAFACSSSKDISQRRSLMMPKVSEMPRNKSKFRELDYSKRNKYQAKKSKERGRNYAYGRK
jgi:hypothetical protein